MAQVQEVNVLLVDDHAATRTFLKRLLQANDLRVVGEAANGLEAVRQCQQLRPDVVVLDVSMPLLNGFEAAQQIAQVSPDSKIVFLTGHVLKEYAREAFRLGGAGFVFKERAVRDLTAAIETALRGGTYLSDVPVA